MSVAVIIGYATYEGTPKDMDKHFAETGTSNMNGEIWTLANTSDGNAKSDTSAALPLPLEYFTISMPLGRHT